MRLLSRIKLRDAILALAAVVLAACTVVVDEDRPGPRPIPDGGFYTREFDPVCGRRGGDRRTFANACLADNAGFRVVRRGECRRSDDRDEPRACTREYDPVCARRGGDRQTFSNACVAEAAGYRVLDRGECRRGGGGEEPRFCTREYNPVCARRGGDVRTFPNACEAESARYRIVSDEPC